MAGLEIVNDNGSVIINPDHKLQVVSERGSFRVRSSYTDKPGYGTVTFIKPITTETTPTVFVRYITGNFTFFSAYFRFLGSPGNWTGFRIISSVSNGSQLQNHLLEYVSCKYVDSLSPMDAGLQLFDSTGAPIFDSNYRPVKYSKMATTWRCVRTEGNWVSWVTAYCDIPIEEDDFICISQIDRGVVFMSEDYAYTGLDLKRNNNRVLQIFKQNDYYNSWGYDRSASRFLFVIPICKFPRSVYPEDGVQTT